MDSETSGRPRFWQFIWVVLLFIALATLLKLPTILNERTEPDESVYLTLAYRMLNGQPYSLQGTEVMKILSPGIYDHPLFHHPPLFPALLVPFVAAKHSRSGIFLSWLGHGLSIVGVAMLLWRMMAKHEKTISPFSVCIWVPLLGIALDPLCLFLSGKIWVEDLQNGLMFLSLGSVMLADGKRKSLFLLAGGVSLGLAALMKLVALVASPILALAVFMNEKYRWKETFFSLLWVGVPALVLIAPWLIVFYKQFGVLLPSWYKPDAYTIENYPFIRAAVNRQWYYYVVQLCMITPVFLLTVLCFVFNREMRKHRCMVISMAWFTFIFVVMTAISVTGAGFQMRYISASVASLYVLTAGCILFSQRAQLITIIAALLIAYSGVTYGSFVWQAGMDQMPTVFEYFKLKREYKLRLERMKQPPHSIPTPLERKP